MPESHTVYFEADQEKSMRIVSVVASCVSIIAGLIAFYLYISMKKKVFRHHLILLLLLCDFGKAVVLLWYPARVLLVPSAYNNINFCQVVGFFTSAFIEGADLAVLVLAIHTALLIFRKSTGNESTEGGLYQFRNYVYAINFLLPIFMAGLAFVNRGRNAYTPNVTWCYLPVTPYWYRLVLSWVPRYIILLSILVIYLSIYIYVKLEYRKVVKDYKKSQTYISSTLSIKEREKRPILTKIKDLFSFSRRNSTTTQHSHIPPRTFKQTLINIYFHFLRFISYFPGLSFLEPDRLLAESGSNPNNMDSAIRDFQKDSFSRFRNRRNMIERQIRSIFLYPIAYLFLWIAPFSVHILQYRQHSRHSSVFWVSAISAYMQPFNCAVDTLVFCIRERPWVDREEKIFTQERLHNIKQFFAHPFHPSKRVPADSNSKEDLPLPDYESTIENESFKIQASRKHSRVKSNNKSISGSMKPPSYQTDISFEAQPPAQPPTGLQQSHSEGSSKLNNTSLNSKSPSEDDVFTNTAKRVEFPEGDGDESEGEMDLMEFLR